MAQLKSAARRKLPASSFAYPKSRRYPIDTKARARNALARAAQSGTKGSYSTVARAVRRKYGNGVASVGRKRGKVSSPGYRKAATTRRRSSSSSRRMTSSRSMGRRR